MAETTEFVSRISVKDLISAFESKSETVKVEFTRPRARSFGNVLNKNVIVRLNEYITLEDIEKGLTKLETDLNFYLTYNKAKHVAFQEQFFNILTSIANIENEEEDSPVRKKNLISRTQTLVSFLNQKLPSNINQPVETTNQYKYTTYSSHKENPQTESNISKTVETTLTNGTTIQPSLYIETSGTVDVTNSGEEYFVSVKKLKENFLKTAQKSVELTKQERVVNKITQKTTPKVDTQDVEQPKAEEKQIEEVVTDEKVTTSEEKVEAVSVIKLRSLFEQRSEENSKGLEIITVDKPKLSRNTFGGSMRNMNLPYTERNLGLHRSVSGNYMNYSGLLKRVDINRSNSALDVNRNNQVVVDENTSDDDSSAQTDDTVRRVNEPIKIEEVETNYSETTDDQEHGDVEKKHVANVKDSEEIQVKFTSNNETKENNNSEDYTTKSSITFVSKNEKVSNLKGYGEEEVSYSEPKTEDLNQNTITEENELSFKGVDEVEVNSGLADSKSVLVQERIAQLEAIADASQHKTASEVIKKTQNEASLTGFEEQEVNHGITRTENVQIEENVAEFEATTDVTTSGSDNEVVENNTESSAFSSLHDLEDERERSLIEEVIEKIDVEQTLANADLVVNPEDLKNADDEFEKLIENNGTNK